MVSTRSAAKQTHIEEFTDNKSKSKTPASTKKEETSPSKTLRKDGKSPKPAQSNRTDQDDHLTKQSSPKKFARKRVDPPQTAGNGPPASKRTKTEGDSAVKDEEPNQATITKDGNVKKAEPEDKDEQGDYVTINRAPVLHLWAACVTQFTHPKLPWSTCLSAGSAVSALCAISKGRSIGTVPEADPSKEPEKAKRRQAEGDLDELQVMQFHLKLKDGKALVSGKPSSDHEETLSKKFKGRYDDVKKQFETCLERWKDDEETLNTEAFGMYETFRPNVAKGQKGWGRAGSLGFDTIRSTVRKNS